MLKTCITSIIVVCLSVLDCFAVQSIDSLEQILSKNISTDQKIDLLKSFGTKHITSDSKTAFAVFQELIIIGQSRQDAHIVSYANNKIGLTWFEQGDLKKSTEFYFKALEQLPKIKSNYALLCDIYNNIGWNFKQQGDFKRALHYYISCKKYCENCEVRSLHSEVLNNHGVVLKDLKRYNEAMIKLQGALIINQADNNNQQELHNLYNLGTVCLELEEYDLANKYFFEVLNIHEKRKNYHEVANNLLNLGDSFFRQERYEESEEMLTKCIYYSKITGSNPQKQKAFKLLYEIKVKKRQFEQALDYYTKFNSLEDSLFLNGQYTDLLELEAKYKLAEKERSLQRSQNQILKHEYMNTFYIVALAFAIVLIAFLFWIYAIKKRNEAKLLGLNKKIDERNDQIQGINNNLEKMILKRTRVIREQNNRLREFAFINSHNIRRPLSSVMGLLNLIEDENDPEKIRELVYLTLQTAEEMDEIIKDINEKLNKDQV